MHSTSKKHSPIAVTSVTVPRVEGAHQLRDGEQASPRGVGVVVHRVSLAGGHTIGINEIKCMSVFFLFFFEKVKPNFSSSEKDTKKTSASAKFFFYFSSIKFLLGKKIKS